MNEMCSMVEELARIIKGFEWQLNNKKPEIETILLNMTNTSRKIDEN
jgi:hypothetical protein